MRPVLGPRRRCAQYGALFSFMMLPAIPFAAVEAFFTERQHVAAKTLLLPPGRVATHLYVVVAGCVRAYVKKDRQQLTVEFFLENEPFAGLESFLSGAPSELALQAIEPSTLLALPKAEFDRLLAQEPIFRDWFLQLVTARFLQAKQRLLTHLRDKPERRYDQLLRHAPHLLRRLPQQYLASYLGVTRVSLSRIRGRRRD